MNKLHHHELKDKMMSESEDDEVAAPDDDKPKRVVARKASAGDAAAASMKTCQVDNCCADLTDAKPYHRRHKVCERHAKAQATVVAGIRQRFCQQCSRFHELQEFDDAKRSCRRRLAGHNERRRKNLAADGGSQAEGGRMKGGNTAANAQLVCGQVNDKERSQMQQAVQENASYKHFHVR